MSPPLRGFRPFETSQPSRPSPSLSALFTFVPSLCSSAFVRPSPSQSDPPSDPSRGSDPFYGGLHDRLAFLHVVIHSSPCCVDVREPAVLSVRAGAHWGVRYVLREFAGRDPASAHPQVHLNHSWNRSCGREWRYVVRSGPPSASLFTGRFREPNVPSEHF